MSTIPQSYYDAIKKQESGGLPYVKAPTSSASGLYQFIKSTWIGLGGTWGNDSSKAFGGLRPSVAEQESKIRQLTAENASLLNKWGVPVDAGALYAVHVFGPKAKQILTAPATALLDDVATKAQMDANPYFKGWTVAKFKTWAMGKGGGAFNDVAEIFQCPTCKGAGSITRRA